MKNVQIVDGADNCTYSIYAISDALFEIIFPGECDLEFIEDLIERIGEDRLDRLFAEMWDHPIEKTQVSGIHGTLFYQLRDQKHRFYPNKRFYDNVFRFSASQRRKFGF